jgi:hypothetical protein
MRAIAWHYIPAQPDKILPEQWQARVEERSVAAVMRKTVRGSWRGEFTVLMVPPDDAAAPYMATLVGFTLEAAKASTNEDLRALGW